MLMKVLLVVIVIAVIYFVFFRKVQKIDNNETSNNAIKDKEDIMAECKKCGVYISNKEAIIKDGNYYCSKECAGVR